MKPRKSFLLRMSHELYEALEGWAQQEFRSVNAQIEYLLKEAVRKRGRAVSETAAPQGAVPEPRGAGGESGSGPPASP